MFTLQNAWNALKRHKGHTVSICILTFLITTGALTTSIYSNTLNSDIQTQYNALQPVAQIIPNASLSKKYNGEDSTWTKNYLTWDTYTNYAQALQSAGMQIQFTINESIPVRSTDSFTSISDTKEDQDKTGGDFTLIGLYTKVAQDNNSLGDISIVSGKDLDYESTNTNTTDALISQEVAEKNNLKVGSKFTVANPTDANKTYTFTVRGIYKYTSQSTATTTSKLSKDNRENAIYITYTAFSGNNLDPQSSESISGWSVPNLNIQFILSSPSDYTTFQSTLASKIAKGYTIQTPTFSAFEEQVKGEKQLANNLAYSYYTILVIGFIFSIALLLRNWNKRIYEIGNAITVGLNKSRISWQFTVEVLFQTILGFIAGILTTAFVILPSPLSINIHSALSNASINSSIIPSIFTILFIYILVLILAQCHITRLVPFKVFSPESKDKSENSDSQTSK
ncbi:MAG: ABC transporter permease [Bifidobacteriaceae bacterium]|nr:ABC transporter permease [Bifidobacteriaceae bacterium]